MNICRSRLCHSRDTVTSADMHSACDGWVKRVNGGRRDASAATPDRLPAADDEKRLDRHRRQQAVVLSVNGGTRRDPYVRRGSGLALVPRRKHG